VCNYVHFESNCISKIGNGKNIDHIFIFALSFILWVWLNLHVTREKKKRGLEIDKRNCDRKTQQQAGLKKTQAFLLFVADISGVAS
jgi:hypothetical protein